MKMHDWRLTDPPDPVIDTRLWTLEVTESSAASFRLTATCPDGTERQVWIEIQDGKLAIHAYDPEHDEPVTLRISKTGITIDSDRSGDFLKHYDLPRYEAIEALVRQMAGMSLPEEEFRGAGCADVDEYVADLDDERLCGEYDTFMDMVRAARSISG